MSKLSDFDLDLSVGHEGESLVNQLLTNGKTIEVKTDLKWKNTGKLIVPIEHLRHAITLYGHPITCNIEPNPSKGYLIQPERILQVVKELSK